MEEDLEDEIEEGKNNKKNSKEEKKKLREDKKRLKQEKADFKGEGDEDMDEDEGGTLSAVFITIFIVLIWLVILAMLIKLDVGGFGTNVLSPMLKDVPVINKILPKSATAVGEDGELIDEYEGYNLQEAVEQIKRLELELQDAKAASQTNTDGTAALEAEISRLKTFEEGQVEFQKIKTEFYEEVVFSDNAPDLSEYKAFYESIDPENAEALYKQVISQIETDSTLNEYVEAYSAMKPKQAAAIFEAMPDNLDLTAKILGAMASDERAKILGAMTADLASKVTKIMDPE